MLEFDFDLMLELTECFGASHVRFGILISKPSRTRRAFGLKRLWKPGALCWVRARRNTA